MEYTFQEHAHRFAVWTAARAVQRNFTLTRHIETAIAATSLRQFSESGAKVTQTEFDAMHLNWCRALQLAFDKAEVICTYGRAAKIVAVYLKTAYILSAGSESVNIPVIHPPIDRILLQNLARKELYKLLSLHKINWTSVDEPEYWKLVNDIRSINLNFNWQLEEDWKCNDT